MCTDTTAWQKYHLMFLESPLLQVYIAPVDKEDLLKQIQTLLSEPLGDDFDMVAPALAKVRTRVPDCTIITLASTVCALSGLSLGSCCAATCSSVSLIQSIIDADLQLTACRLRWTTPS